MSGDAGFAASMVIRQSALQDLLRLLHHAGDLPHALTGSDFGITVDLFLDVPQITCAVANGGQVALLFVAWGNLTLPTDGFETRQVMFQAGLLAAPLFALEMSSLIFQI